MEGAFYECTLHCPMPVLSAEQDGQSTSRPMPSDPETGLNTARAVLVELSLELNRYSSAEWRRKAAVGIDIIICSFAQL